MNRTVGDGRNLDRTATTLPSARFAVSLFALLLLSSSSSSSSPATDAFRSPNAFVGTHRVNGGGRDASRNRKRTWTKSETRQRRRRRPTATFVFSRLDRVDAGSIGGGRANPRSSSSSSSPRGSCPRCHRPEAVCICRALPDRPIDCGTRVLILQHPREARKRKRTSTVPLIVLSVRDVVVCVGTEFREGSHPLLDEALAGNVDGGDGHALLLYPSDRAVPLRTYLGTAAAGGDESSKEGAGDDGRRRNGATGDIDIDDCNGNGKGKGNILVVVDGTWAQTQSMVRRSRVTLDGLPNVMFDEETDSLFDSLRREPARHCTSTLEAVSRAIRMLPSPTNSGGGNGAGEKAADALERSLAAMVEGQLGFALDRSRPRYARSGRGGNDAPGSERGGAGAGGSHRSRSGGARKAISRRLRTSLGIPRAKTAEEVEAERVRFVYVAHLG